MGENAALKKEKEELQKVLAKATDKRDEYYYLLQESIKTVNELKKEKVRLQEVCVKKEKRWYVFGCDKNFGNVHHATYNIREDALAMGWDKFNKLIKWYKHCLLLGAWDESYGFYAEADYGIFDVHCPWWYQG